MRGYKSMNPLAIYLLIFIHQTVDCHPEFGKRQKCPVVDRGGGTRVFVSATSDHELFAKANRGSSTEADVSGVSDDTTQASSSRHKAIAADQFDANFYDPSYGFSKESIGNIRYGENDKDPLPPVEPITYTDVQNNRGVQQGKTYGRHVIKFVDQNGKRLNSFIKKDPVAIVEDSKHAASYSNPLSYYKSFAEPTKLEDDFDTSFRQGNSGSYASDSEEYDKYVKDIFRKLQKYSSSNVDELQESTKNYKRPDIDHSQDYRGVLYPSTLPGSSYKPYNDYPKKHAVDQTQYLADIYEQSRALTSYFDKLKNSGIFDTEVTETDEFNTLKLRESARERRNKRPRGSSRSPRGHSRGKKCSGRSCGGRSRRPRFSSF